MNPFIAITLWSTLGLSGPESNGNEGITPHFLELQKWSLVSY